MSGRDCAHDYHPGAPDLLGVDRQAMLIRPKCEECGRFVEPALVQHLPLIGPVELDAWEQANLHAIAVRMANRH